MYLQLQEHQQCAASFTVGSKSQYSKRAHIDYDSHNIQSARDNPMRDARAIKIIPSIFHIFFSD